MSAEAKNPCGALGQLTLRDGAVTVGCGLEKGHDVEVRVLRQGAFLNEYTPADVPGRIAPSLWGCMRVEVEATPHRFWAEWRAESGPAAVAEEPEWEGATGRDFGFTEILVSDYPGQSPRPFTVQQSSLATECKVWIGVGDTRAHMSIEEATRVRDALNAFLADAWVPVEEDER